MVKPRRLDRLTASGPVDVVADDLGWSEDIGVLAILDGTGLRDDAGCFRIQAVRGRSSRSCTWSPASGSWLRADGLIPAGR